MERILRPVRLFWPFLWRDLREQHAGSLLGLGWSFGLPFLFVATYWFVFSVVMQVRAPALHSGVGVPYVLFLLTAFIPWVSAQEALTRGASAIVDKRMIVKKVLFPVAVFPCAVAGGVLIRYAAVYLVLILAVLFWRGSIAPVQLLEVIALLALQALAVFGAVLLLSALAVYVRDIQQVLTPILQVMLFTAPILYPIDNVPEAARNLMQLNPFTLWATSYHDALLGQGLPWDGRLVILVAEAILLYVAGRWVFRRLKQGFADVL